MDLSFYSSPGPMTDTGPLGRELDDLPTSPRELARAIQGLLVHIFWARRYGLDLSPEHQGEVNLRWLDRQLARVKELDPAPLGTPRPLERRLVGNCRDFSLFFAGILRRHGLPARARCGFATYFNPGTYEDHWVGEYFDPERRRWVMVDAQLDALQREALDLDFDPLDVPPDRFLTGGVAWRLCREGGVDPDRFGIRIPGGPDLHGLWFVQGDLIRDFLALNKIEILPWDEWGLMQGPGQALTAEDAATLDHLAALTREPDAHFEEIRHFLATDPQLAARPDWWHE